MKQEELAQQKQKKLDELNKRIKNTTESTKSIAKDMRNKLELLKVCYERSSSKQKNKVHELTNYSQLICYLTEKPFSNSYETKPIELKHLVYTPKSINRHIENGLPKNNNEQAIEIYSFYFGGYRAFFRCFTKEFLELRIKQKKEFINDVFSPKEGDYYVSGERLIIEGATIIDEEFIQKVKSGKTFSMLEYYTAMHNELAQWYGVINKFDIEREDYSYFKSNIYESFNHFRTYKVSGIVYGNGGCGKSTMLRRLAIDFHKEQLFSVVWLNDNSVDSFVKEGLYVIENNSLKKENTSGFLIIIEDWDRMFNDKPDLANEFLKRTDKIDGVRIVLGDRNMVEKPYLKHLNHDTNPVLLASDENQQIIEKITEKYPDWKTSSEKLFKKQQNYESTLFLLLFILARTNQKASILSVNSLSEPKTLFLEIIESDLKFMFKNKKHIGLAKALYYWACFYSEHKILISYETFLHIADFYNGKNKNEIIPAFSRWKNKDDVLDKLKIYINRNEELYGLGNRNYIQFNHDILADEGLSKICFEDWQRYGETVKLKMLDIIIDKGDDYSASVYVHAMLTRQGNLFDDKIQKLKYIDFLLDKNNRQVLYLNVLHMSLSTQQELEKYAELLWDREIFPIPFWKFVLKNGKSNYWADKILTYNNIEKINLEIVGESLKYRSENLSFDIFFEKLFKGNNWKDSLEILPTILYFFKQTDLVQNFVESILKDNNWRQKQWYLVRVALYICNDLQLVQEFSNNVLRADDWEEVDKDILIASLNISTNEELKYFFINEVLKERNIERIDFDIIQRCLVVSTDENLKMDFVQKIYDNKKWMTKNPFSVIELFSLDLINKEIKQKYFKNVLDSEHWEDQNPGIVYMSLNLLLNNDNLRKEFSEKVLKNISYCSKHSEVFLLALSVINNETKRIKSVNNYYNNADLDSQKQKKVIGKLLKIVNNQKIAMHYLKEWLSSDWKYNQPIYDFLYCFNNEKQLPELVNKVIEQIIEDYHNSSDMKMYFYYVDLMKIGFHSNFTWKNEATTIIKYWRKHERAILQSVLQSHYNYPQAIKRVCFGILYNWKREVNKPSFHNHQKLRTENGTHLKIALGHPMLKEQSKATATEIITFLKENNKSIPTALLDIVNFDIYPSWES